MRFRSRQYACGGALVPWLLLAVSPSAAEVLDTGAAGFSVRHRVEIAAPRAQVYLAAVNAIGSWWSDDYTVSGDAHRLYLEARPQGCFCEALASDAGVVHMTVTFVNPEVMLRLSGGLGPLGLMGVAGNMTWEFEDSDAGTTVTWTYAVGGYLPDGAAELAPAVDAVLTEQMQALKGYVEHRAEKE